MTVSGVIWLCLELYAAVGVVTALAFVSVGVTQVLPHPMPISPGARIFIAPGAAALWPYIVIRWLRARSHP
jgi:hypothetical protein